MTNLELQQIEHFYIVFQFTPYIQILIQNIIFVYFINSAKNRTIEYFTYFGMTLKDDHVKS